MLTLTALAFFYVSNASALTHAIPVVVGDAGALGFYTNVPYVSVKLCVPGTQTCKTINHVQLDTGSVGLRIFKSALEEVRLPADTDALGGAENAECFSYGGGDVFWGSIAKADVWLGDEVAPSARLQIVDSKYATLPYECGHAMSELGYANGILGVSIFPSECYGKDCVPGMRSATNFGLSYYQCQANQLCEIARKPIAEQLQNIIALFANNNNGYVLDFPSVPSEGAVEEKGTLTFGVDTDESNRTDGMNTPIQVDEFGYFKAKLSYGNSQIEVGTMIDSGTAYWNFPNNAKITLPLCADGSSMICPAPSIDLVVQPLPSPTTENSTIKINLINPSNVNLAALADANLGMESSLLPGEADLKNYLYLGLPFYLGKKVFEKFPAKRHPLGSDSWFGWISH